MLSPEQAAQVVGQNLPDSPIQTHIRYQNLYVFHVQHPDVLEGDFDSFYSVDINTGKFDEFSVITDGDLGEIMSLFQEAKSKA